jgi:hypothetical protein
MAKLRGRPLAWTALLIATWIGARLSITAVDHGTGLSLVTKAVLPAQPVDDDRPLAAAPLVTAHSDIARTLVAPAPKPLFQPALLLSSGSPPANYPWQDGSRPSGLHTPAMVASSSKPLSSGRDTPPSKALAPVGKAGPPESKRRLGAEVYAYSFWRFSTAPKPTLAPQAQYGGSQSGLILTVDPFGSPNKGPAMLFRGAFAPYGQDKELALGLRWRPAENIPFSLSAERRFRIDGPDRFSFYAAGGFDRIPVAKELTLDTYGQVGFAAGKGGGGFFDAQAKLTHPLVEIGGVRIKAGTGAWAGGQRGTSRVDVGPTVAAKFDAGPAPILLQLDWRLRVAGDAAPKDGMALTVSTGF